MEFAKAFIVKALMGSQPLTSVLILLLWTISLASILVFMAVKIHNRGRGKNLPGNLGLPLIGETLQFMRAHKANKSNEWVHEKVSKYGLVFKMSLMGRPTVVRTGQDYNDYNLISNKQASWAQKLV